MTNITAIKTTPILVLMALVRSRSGETQLRAKRTRRWDDFAGRGRGFQRLIAVTRIAYVFAHVDVTDPNLHVLDRIGRSGESASSGLPNASATVRKPQWAK
jgi:hypothetical protein